MRSAADRSDRQRRHRAWRWSAGPPGNFLDGRTDLAAAYSMRLLRSNYTGPLVRLRRASDNAELDFYSGFFLNYSDVSGWAGGNAFATTFYDQSGLARHLTQASASAQPQIIQAANGRPALLFDGVNDYLRTAAFAQVQPWSFNVIYRRIANPSGTTQNVFDGITADRGTLYAVIGTTDNKLYAGGSWTDNNLTAMPVGTRGVVGGVFNAAASLYEVNAASIISSAATGTLGTNNLDGLTLGTDGGLTGARFSNIEAQEMAMFSGAQTSAAVAARNALMRTGWGF